MIGMTSNDLQACAGVPASTHKLNDTTQIYQYTGTIPVAQPSGSTLIPIDQILEVVQKAIGGSGTTCTTVVRLDHDRVSDVHYVGDNDEMIGTDGICSIITRGCARQPTGSMRVVSGSVFGPVSAFHQPTGPNQSASATYSKQAEETTINFDDKTKPVIQPRS